MLFALACLKGAGAYLAYKHVKTIWTAYLKALEKTSECVFERILSKKLFLKADKYENLREL